MSRTPHQSQIDLALVFADESAEPFPEDLMKRISIAIVTENLLDQLNWLLREELTEDRRGKLARICLGLEDQLDEAKQSLDLRRELGDLIQVAGWPHATRQFKYFAKGFSFFEDHYTKFSDDLERWTEINWGYNEKYVSKFQSAITELRAFVNVSYAHLNGIGFKESLAKMKRFRWEQRTKEYEERQQRVDELFAELLDAASSEKAVRLASSRLESQRDDGTAKSFDATEASEGSFGVSPNWLSNEVRASSDFRSVHWHGQGFEFTTKQASVIEALWEASANKTPFLSIETLRDLAGMRENASLSDLFDKGKHPAFGGFVVAGRSGNYRISLEPPKDRLVTDRAP